MSEDHEVAHDEKEPIEHEGMLFNPASEALPLVFRRLSFSLICVCAQVCKEWNSLTKSPLCAVKNLDFSPFFHLRDPETALLVLKSKGTKHLVALNLGYIKVSKWLFCLLCVTQFFEFFFQTSFLRFP